MPRNLPRFSHLKTVPWLKPIRAAGILSLGRGANGIFALVYTALAARDLGVHDFGILILIHSFAIAISQLARFQTWQPLLRYGAQALKLNNVRHLQNILKFCFFLDVVSIVIALVIILFFGGPAARLFGLSPETVNIARLYGLGVVFVNVGSSPGGILRLLDKFGLLSLQSAVEPGVRLIGVLGLYFFSSAHLYHYIAVWFASMIVSKIVLSLMAWRSLRKRGLMKGFDWSIPGPLAPAPDAWRFVMGTNISTTLGLASTQLPTLMVGWLLGPSGAGIFKIAQQFAGVLTKANSKLLVPAIYADFSHLAAAGNDKARRHMTLRTAALAGGAGLTLFLILVFWGRPLIAAFGGPGFEPAYIPTLWLAFAGIIDAAFFPLEPLLISAGKIRQTTYIRLITAAVYLSLLYFLLPALGVNGASIATLGFEIAGGILLVLASRPLLRKEDSNCA